MIDIKGFSPRYTAPEVFGKVMTNLTNISIEDEMKGDVYSYAVILWEMMSRKIPWANCILSFFFHFFFIFFSFFIFIFHFHFSFSFFFPKINTKKSDK